jgi:hypothetical protein
MEDQNFLRGMQLPQALDDYQCVRHRLRPESSGPPDANFGQRQVMIEPEAQGP